ncbi:MAG TPA: FAD-binding protein [Firmicutes bacterium]|nr:FAD-binding protein [Bacillota bacterium]
MRQVAGPLEEIVGAENVLTEAEDLFCYAYDSTHVEFMPDVVVRPGSADEVARIVRLANELEVPVVPRGSGTGLSGGSVPIEGGIVMDLTRLNRILEVNVSDLYAVVEPGTITLDFANKVEAEGLLYPPDPGSNSASTLGGNVAENAGGLRGLKYGVTKDYVMGLEVVSPTGELFNTGSKTVKCVTGFDLTRLIVGSEGTLGVVTKIILKLVPKPEFAQAMQAIFDEVGKAASAVSAIIRAGIVPATLEILDNVTINAIEDYKPAGLPRDAAAVLLIEADGAKEAVQRQVAQIDEICRREGARKIDVARDEAEKAKVWAGRRAALAALARVKPTTILEDATVPRSKIPEMVAAINSIAKEYNLTVGTFGHAGDGNLHPTFLVDERDKDEMARVEKATYELFRIGLSLGGTLSGEHGIGITKAKFLHWELGKNGVEVMKRIKRALDPKNILNPGKMELGGGRK